MVITSSSVPNLTNEPEPTSGQAIVEQYPATLWQDSEKGTHNFILTHVGKDAQLQRNYNSNQIEAQIATLQKPNDV